jgi:SAM-dependent methyltransferase
MNTCEFRSQREVGDVSVEAGRARGQLGWYRFAARIAAGHTVLDAGCGLGYGLTELRRMSTATGQDLDPRLLRDGILIAPIEEIPSKSFDFVVSVDVVEHVAKDKEFVCQLARIAKLGIFLTTPLSFYKRPLWPYHIREYRAHEFLDLLYGHGKVIFFTGDQAGNRINQINMRYFWTIDALINSRITNIPFRAVQKLFPSRFRYNGHQGALVWLQTSRQQ